MAFLKFRGRVKIAERLSDGAPGTFWDPGCPAQLAIALAEEVNEIREKCSGFDGVAVRDVTSQTATISLSLYEGTLRNLLLGLQGSNVAGVTGGSVTGELAPTGALAGLSTRLGGKNGHQNITSLVVEANSVTLVEGTDYTLNAASGMVDWITTPTYPVEFAYTYDDLPKVAMFTTAAKEYFVAFDARNKLDNFNPAVMELYKVRFSPIANLDLLPDEVTTIDLEGTVLIDDKKDVDDELGQFGWINYQT